MEANSPYFDDWDIFITAGPASVEVSYNFVNIFENEFKPYVEKQLDIIQTCGAEIPSLNISIPPRWTYTETGVDSAYISGRAEYYYGQSESWTSITPFTLENIKQIELQTEFGKSTAELTEYSQTADADPEYLAKITLSEVMINTLFTALQQKTEAIKQIYIGKKGIWLVEKKDGKTVDAAHPIPATQDNKYVNLWNTAEKEYKVKTIKNLIATANISTLFILSQNLQNILFTKNGSPDITRIRAYKKDPKYYYKKLNPDWPVQSLYIDTINYNEFDKEIDELNALYSRFSKLPATEQKLNPTQTNPETGKEYDPVCDKYFPFDYGKLFGLGGLMQFLPFMKVKEQLTWPDRFTNE